MLSAAASGSVSDATKTAPSFVIDSITIEFLDVGGNPLPGAPYIFNNGTSAPVPAASYGTIDSVNLVEMAVTPTQSASSKRATNHPGILGWFMFISGANTATFIDHETHQIQTGDFSGHMGNFAIASEDGPYSFQLPNGGVGHQYQHGTQFTIRLDNAPIEVDNPELAAGVLPAVDAVMGIPQDSLTIFNEATGVYSHGPTDNFVFTIKLQP